MEKFYVTTAIDYVNATPHIGHAYEKIAADIVARYHRIRGKDVFFMTGVDEHGSKVEKSAADAGKTPKQFCDEMAEKFQLAWKKLNLSHDKFIRTTDDEHEKAVQILFLKLLEKGDIYKGTYTGLYCEGCEDFVRERDLDENGNCFNHKKPPKKLEEDNYFFRLTSYKDKIREWLNRCPDAVRPEGRKKEILNQLDDPDLADFSVTRSRKSLTWGITIPGIEDQVIYVWIDALSNYITGVGYPHDPEKFARYWPADLHLIGKDINKFHSIFWPALLMAADIAVPKQVFAHGFITVNGQKISKSLGNVIDPIALVDTYSADAVRFYLFAGTPFDNDGDFSIRDFADKVNAELANNLGNLLNRVLVLADKNCGGTVPMLDTEKNIDHTLRVQANEIHVIVDKHMEKLEFAKAIEAIFALVDQANKYLNDEKPWTLFKEGKTEEGAIVLFTCMEVLRRAAMNVYPFTPQLAQDIWNQLGYSDDIGKIGDRKDDNFFDVIQPGQKLNNTGPVFKRIELPESDEEKKENDENKDDQGKKKGKNK